MYSVRDFCFVESGSSARQMLENLITVSPSKKDLFVCVCVYVCISVYVCVCMCVCVCVCVCVYVDIY